MSNKLANAVREKYKRSPSKSKIKTSISEIKAINESPQKDKPLIFISEKVNELMDNFNKEISNPIEIYTQIYQAKAPQKCLQHNNISTLYCIKDERLLCAGCMYQTPIHKAHKVLPLNKADEMMRISNKNTIEAIEEHLKFARKTIQKTTDNLEKAEKQYPLFMEQVHNYFMSLHQLLIDRKNEHLQHLNEVWSKLRYENFTMKVQLTRICDYIEGKLRQVGGRLSDDDVTFNKNVIDHLSRIGGIVDQESVEKDENTYLKQIIKFKQVTQFVSKSLVLEKVMSKTIHSLYLADYKLKKSNSKSSIKKNTSNHQHKFSNSPKNNAKQVEKSAEEKLLEMHLGEEEPEERKSPKNRHSINQVKLVKQLVAKKKAFQIEKQKKSKLTPTKSQKSFKKHIAISPKSLNKEKSIKVIKNDIK